MSGRETVLARVGAAARSPRWSLGSLSAADLTLRGDPGAAIVGDLLPSALSLTAGTLSAAVGGALTWLVFAIGYYHAADRIYRPGFGFPGDDPLFRGVVAGSGMAVAWAITRAGLVAAALAGPVATGALLAVLVRRYGWALTDPGGEGVALADRFVPTGDYTATRRESYRAGGLRRGLSTWITAVTVALLVGIPLLLLAFATLVLFAAYPLPEVMLVVWAGAGLLGRLLPGWLRRRVPAVPSPATLETGLYTAAGRAMRNGKGLVMTIAALFGIAAGATLVSASTAQLVSIGPTSAVHPTRVALAVVGLVLTAATGAYTLLFWGVELARLPAFMDRWAGAENPTTPPVGRIPGGLLPLLPAVPLFVATALAIDTGAALRVVRVLLVGWLATGLVLVVTTVCWLAGGTRRSVAGEDHYVAVGVLALLAAISSLAYRESLVLALEAGRLPPVRGLLALPVAVLLMGILYMDDVERAVRGSDGLWRFGFAAFMIGMGGAVILAARPVPEPWRGRFTLGGGLIVCLGGVAAALQAVAAVLTDAGAPDGG